MLKTYLRTFFRKFKREKLFTLLNLSGLTVGLATVLLIALFIKSELSFDQHNSRKDNVFLLWQEGQKSGQNSSRVPYRMAKEIREEVPSVEALVSLQSRNELVSNGEESFYNNNVAYTSRDIFKVFDINLLAGKEDAFEQPGIAMISEVAAAKYFGSVENAMGKVLKVEEKTSYEVKGVFANLPSNSSIEFDFLLSGETMFEREISQKDSKYGYFPTQNWLLLNPEHNIEQVRTQMAELIKESMFYNSIYEESGPELPYHLLNLTDVHLRSDLNFTRINTSDIRYVYLFTAIGFLILLIAIINYTNLTTAQSMKRSKEVGLRKVVGASKSQMVRFYLAESFVMVFISSVFAFAIAERVLPLLNQLMEREMSLDYFSTEFLLIILGTTLVIGLFAGVYPAFFLSKANPLQALQGSRTQSKNRVRKFLIVSQFFIAQLLIVATVIIQQQLNFIQNKNLGYDREHLIEIKTHDKIIGKEDVFKTELQRLSGVNSVSVANSAIDWNDIAFLTNDHLESDLELSVVFDFFNVDKDFLKTLKMEIAEGRDFIETDEKVMIINQAAVKEFGWDSFEGKSIEAWGKKFKVIGVVKDFHNESLKSEIRSTGIALNKNSSSHVIVRLSPLNIKETMTQIEDKWNELNSGRPLDFKFYDQDYDNKYKAESRLGKLFLSFAGLAIFIALLGLIGLSTFTLEQRSKEISLRRVLGAEFKQIFSLFAKGYLVMIALGFVIAAPVVYYMISGWLEEFVYRIQPGVAEFSFSIITTITLVLVVLLLQVLKTSRVNPAQVLRNQ